MQGTVNVGSVILVGLCLVAAVLVDAAVQPRTYFVSSPFAIPILVATYRFPPRGVAITTILATAAAIVAASVDKAAPVPATLTLLGLVIVGSLAILLGKQRQVTIERARESEEARQQVANILDSITDAFVAVDRHWRLTYLNTEAQHLYERFYRASAASLVGQNLWEAFPALVGTQFDRESHRAIAEHATVTFEAFFKSLGAWFDVRVYPSPAGLSIYIRDITVRKRTEEERDELLAREQALAEIADALVRERELTGVVDVALTESLRVIGADVVGVWRAETMRRELTLLASRGKSRQTTYVLQRLSFDAPSLTARAARDRETQVIEDVQATARELPLMRQIAAAEGVRSVLATPMIARGHLVGVVTYGWHLPRHFTPRDLGFDATIADLFAVAIENAQLYEEVRQALLLREEFMAAAAHELRTPVTVIKGRTQMLLKTDAKDQRVRAGLEAVDRHAERMRMLIDDILSVAHLRPGVPALRRTRFDLGALTREVTDQVARTVETHQFQTKIDGALFVDADAPLIRQVVSRLLENALRYSPEGGLIEVGVRRQDDNAVVSVTDHGVGIAFDRQPHVFEPLYQPVPPGVTGYVGTVSLGLYLSKQIVEAHGGQIGFTSTPGRGSTFWFSLRLREN